MERREGLERKAACRGQIKEEFAKKEERMGGGECLVERKGTHTECRSHPRVIKNAVVVLAIRMTNDVVDGAKLVR